MRRRGILQCADPTEVYKNQMILLLERILSTSRKALLVGTNGISVEEFLRMNPIELF
jgi:hypothetical protein